MALTKTMSQIEEDEKKRLEEELKARQAEVHKQRLESDRSRFADLFNAGSPQAQQAGQAMMAQSVFNNVDWNNSPDKASMPEQYVMNQLQPKEEPRNPELDAMVLGEGDAPVTPEQAQAQVDNRSKLQRDLDALKVNQPAVPQAMEQKPDAIDFVGQAFASQQPQSPYATQQNQLEEQHGLPKGYLSNTARIESGNNPNAKNPKSSASGLYQFTEGTAKQYGLTDPFDPVASTDAMVRFTKDNQAQLRKVLGREPTGEELYMAHQQGATGALRVIQGDPQANAVSVLGREQVLNNGGNENMTLQEFKDKWAAKYNQIDGSVAQPAPSVDTPKYEKIVTVDDYIANSDNGVSNAVQGGVPQNAASVASKRQFDENGRFVVRGDEGINFQTDFQHMNRETSDTGALWQALLTGGMAMLLTRIAGGDRDEVGTAFAVGAGTRFADALNQSHRYKNINSLTKMGYTPESIEAYVTSGDRSQLQKHQIGDWKEYPDGSGDMYRMLPNGDTEFRQGNPKWEAIKNIDENGVETTSYWNPFYGQRTRVVDGVEVPFTHVTGRVSANTKPVAAGATPQTYVHTNPQTGAKEEVTVFTTPQGYVSVSDRTTPVTLGADAQLKDKPKGSAKGVIDPNSDEGKAIMVAQRREGAARQQLISDIAGNPAIANVTGMSGVITGPAYTALDPETKYLVGQFNQLFSKDFLENISKMKGYGSLSNAEGAKVSSAANALSTTDANGKTIFNNGLPNEAVMWELRQMVEGSLGYEFMTDYVRQNGSEPVYGTPEYDAVQQQMNAYIQERMPDPLKDVQRYVPGKKDTQKTQTAQPVYSKGNQPSNTFTSSGGVSFSVVQ